MSLNVVVGNNCHDEKNILYYCGPDQEKPGYVVSMEDRNTVFTSWQYMASSKRFCFKIPHVSLEEDQQALLTTFTDTVRLKKLNIVQSLEFMDSLVLAREDSVRYGVTNSTHNGLKIIRPADEGRVPLFDKVVEWWIAKANRRNWVMCTWRHHHKPLTNSAYNLHCTHNSTVHWHCRNLTDIMRSLLIMEARDPPSELEKVWIGIQRGLTDYDLLWCCRLDEFVMWTNKARYRSYYAPQESHAEE